MIQSANISNLASLLSLNHDLEEIPEPYRMQKNLSITIGFEVFKDYILHCNLSDGIIFIDCACMKDCIYRADPVISNYYHKYLAIAQLKELSIAQAFDAYATTILPEVPNNNKVTIDEIRDAFMYTSLDIEALNSELSKQGYNVKSIGENDRNFTCYALAAYYYSKTFLDDGKVQELFNVVV